MKFREFVICFVFRYSDFEFSKMEDLSLHILDIIENSIDAGAQKIEIRILEDLKLDLLKIEIIDDGKGMDEGMLKKALNPFFTTKTVRKVGLGLSLFREAARMANGGLVIRSGVDSGTKVSASFQHSHIDRKPLGDMSKTMMTLIIGHPEIRIKYLRQKDDVKYTFDTEELEIEGDLSSISTIELMKLVEKSLQV